MAVKPLLSLLFDEEKDQINKTWELKYVFQHSPWHREVHTHQKP